jgi:hypothetical protein
MIVKGGSSDIWVNMVPISQRADFSIIKASQLMLFGKIIAVNCKNHSKQKYIVWEM